MIEVGGIYKLKKLNLPYIHNDENTYEVLYEISPNVVVCLNTDTRENVVLQKQFFIDPECPDEDTFEGVTIEPTTIVTEDMGGCVAAGGLGGGMASLGAAPCPTMAQASNGASGAMVNGVPVEGKSVKKKKKKKNEAFFTKEQLSPTQVTPEEMIEMVEETFDSMEVLQTIVKNNREIIKVTVCYDNPKDHVLTHLLNIEYLDVDEETVIDEVTETELSIQDCKDELVYIFSTHDAIDGEMYENIVDDNIENIIVSLLQENVFKDMEDAKKQYVQDTKNAEEYLKELKTLSKKELIDLLPHPFGQDDIDYYNTKDEKDLITIILKKKFNLAGEYVGKHFNEEYEEESGYYMDKVEGILSYVTPDEMLEKIEDTFESTDGFYTVVENPRERIRVTVKYTNPDEKILTHALQLEFLDEVDNTLDTLYEENLSQIEVLDRLQEIFSMHQEANLIVEEYVNSLLEDFNEEYEEITEQIAKYLDRLNFQYANTTDIVYKKEGEYKYLFKFDNEIGVIKIKILKGDDVLVEKEYEIDETQDIQPIFDEIESIYNKYGL